MNSTTEARFKAYARSVEGSWIRWQGWVEDVNEKLLGGYEVWIDMDSPEEMLSVQDITFDIPDSLALALEKNQQIVFEGQISSLRNFLGSLSVGLDSAQIIR